MLFDQTIIFHSLDVKTLKFWLHIWEWVKINIKPGRSAKKHGRFNVLDCIFGCMDKNIPVL